MYDLLGFECVELRHFKIVFFYATTANDDDTPSARVCVVISYYIVFWEKKIGKKYTNYYIILLFTQAVSKETSRRVVCAGPPTPPPPLPSEFRIAPSRRTPKNEIKKLLQKLNGWKKQTEKKVFAVRVPLSSLGVCAYDMHNIPICTFCRHM